MVVVFVKELGRKLRHQTGEKKRLLTSSIVHPLLCSRAMQF